MKSGDVSIKERDRSRPWRTGGTERSGPPPSIRPAASRISLPPRTCTASKGGSSDTREAGSWRKSAGIRESWPRGRSSSIQPGEPERCLLGLRFQVGEGQRERCGTGDQDHVISYSQAAQRRIRSEQISARELTQAAARTVALHRALQLPAHGDADAAERTMVGHGKKD